MLNINKLSSNVVIPHNPYTYVGLPGINKPFAVHPVDQTDPGKYLSIYFNYHDKRNYVIDQSTYTDWQDLYERKLENLSRSVLYRGLYSNGVEFIIPVFLSDTNPISAYLLNLMEIAQKGAWLNRIAANDYSIDSNTYNATWSALTFEELLDKALSEYVIEDDQHPVVKNFKFGKK